MYDYALNVFGLQNLGHNFGITNLDSFIMKVLSYTND